MASFPLASIETLRFRAREGARPDLLGSQLVTQLEASGFVVVEHGSDVVKFRRARLQPAVHTGIGARNVVDSGSIRFAEKRPGYELHLSLSTVGYFVGGILLFALLGTVFYIVDEGLHLKSVFWFAASFSAFVLAPIWFAARRVRAIVRDAIDELPGFDYVE